MNTLITSAISYTNGSPHIGHLYESVICDFINKTEYILDNNSKFLTGTDEHGLKIQKSADSQNISPDEFCNKYANEFKTMNKNIENNYDYFIRTSDNNHKDNVIKIIKQIMQTSDDIYKTTYSGYYNIKEECYVSLQDAKLHDYKDPNTNIPYEYISEDTYNFKTSKYIDNILENINNIITPNDLSNEIITRLRTQHDDLSITRTSYTWGIKMPEDEKHVIYVWFDALLNYITGKELLFGDENVKMVHIIGKDILWFHSVIYPAILQSANIKDIPNKILVHGFVLDKEGKKMSKSIGNVISINDLNKYPIDAIRYYLLSSTILGHDFKFDHDNLQNSYNNLINSFGNTFQRLYKLMSIPNTTLLNEYIKNNKNSYQELQNKYIDKVKEFTTEYDFQNYFNNLQELLSNISKQIHTEKVWSIQDENEKIRLTYNYIKELKIIMCLLYPVITSKIVELGKYIGWNNFKLNNDIEDLIFNGNKIKAFNKL